MDPITAMILAMAVAGITARFIGEGVGEAAAAVKGKPSPAAQKREAREKARRARGERPSASKPGLLRVMWDNAIEERTQKAAAKHVGRMEALREMSGHEQDKARQKLLRQAQRRAAVAERVAGLGNQSWGHARRVAEDTAALVNERRAERSTRRGETPDAVVEVPEPDQPAVEDDGADEGVVHESVDAEVIPLRRKKPSAAEQLQQELADHQAEQERVAAAAGTNAAPTLTMYSDWRRAQGREARTEEELRERFGPATEDDLRATQTRGSFRVIPEWRDANSTWQMWHREQISTQQLHQLLLEDSGIDPRLATEFGMTAADLSPYAAQANACLETDEVYTPPSEAELRAKFGHRVTAAGGAETAGAASAAPKQKTDIERDLESTEVLDPRSAAIKVTQVRGQYRSIEGWGQANAIWRRWHDGEITAAERDAELAAAAGIAPGLATALGMTPAALSEYAGRDMPVSETELRAAYEVPWDNDEQIWADWKKGRITAAERDAELAQFAGLSPRLAEELEIPSEDLGRMAQAANGLFWQTPSEYDLRLHYKPTKRQLELEEYRRARRAAWAARDQSERELLRQQQSRAAGENGPGEPVSENENTVDGGNPDMTTATAQTATVPEIVDLATGIDYTTTISAHFTNLGAKLAEDADVVGNNAAAFDSQVGVIESGQAALAAQGFGGAIQSSFDEVAEKLPSAASKLRQVEKLLAEIGEEITSAASSMQSAKAALEDQRGLAEQVQAQSTSNGVARDTSFYQEA